MSDSWTITLSDETPPTAVSDGEQAHLVQILCCDRPWAPSSRHVLDGVRRVEVGRGGQWSARRASGVLELRVPDRRMSGEHLAIVKQSSGWRLGDLGSKNRTYVNGAEVKETLLVDGDLIESGQTFFLFREGIGTPKGAPLDLVSRDLEAPRPELATFSPELERAFQDLARIAGGDVPVMILGPSGSGKEVVAQALHELSGRKGDFVPVNCGALPETLLEAELFGSKKGSYSGSVQDRPGIVRSADQGTLFLDEIGDLPLPSQAAFLRVLQEKEVTPVGEARPVKVDVRVACATHRDLDAMVDDETFRPDLAARLSGLTVRLPALADRREDMGILIHALLERVAPNADVTLTRRAGRRMLMYDWPLNVRELERCLSTSAALAAGQPIDLEHLPEALKAERTAGEVSGLSAEEVERRDRLVELLKEHGGNVSAVARDMGKARMQIHRWLRRYNISLESFRRS